MCWVHCAVHGDHTARLQARQQSMLAGGDLVDVGVTDDAEADQIASGGEFGR
jgi:hypothetical protein